MTKNNLGALVAAGLLSCGLPAMSASAADLGGNCCADLEERVAELEATAARKGNRKVSLTVSGWVSQQVTYWDDGEESNLYVTDVGTTLATHFKFTGQAQIAPGWTSGYVLHVEAINAEPLAVNQFVDDNTSSTASLNLFYSYWFLQNDRLGKLSIGLQSQASDNAAILVDASGSLVPANWVLFDGAGFFLRKDGDFVTTGPGGVTATWGDIAFCHHIDAGIAADCNGVPLNVVRYDSPTFRGFSFSTSWGIDDMWDITARYAGEWNSIRVAAAAAYSVQHDETPFVGRVPTGVEFERDSEYFQVGVYLQHVPSGLFIYGAYGKEWNDQETPEFLSGTPPVLVGGNEIPDNDHWYLKGGVRRAWTSLGHTVLYAEYAEHYDMVSTTLIDQFDAEESELRRWGVGAVQEIDAAAMSLWVKYRNMDGEFKDGVLNETIDLDEFHLFAVGGMINF